MSEHSLRVGVGLVVALAVCGTLAAADWPQWRGPAGQGHAPDAKGLPVEWSESPRQNVAWRTTIPGRGWSSPVIDGPQIWLTTATESEVPEAERKNRLQGNTNSEPLNVSGPVSLRAVCVDRASGQMLREVELMVEPRPDPIHALNSYASPSPILEGGRLYCHFGTNGTVCLDTEEGRVVWTNREHRIRHENGPGSTPILWKNHLIFHCDGSDRQYIVALDKETGKTVWRTDRSGMLQANPQLKKAYGTPLVIDFDGGPVVVSMGADWLYGYDPQTGRELWKVSYGVLGFSIVPRPVTAHGLLYLSTSFVQPEILALKLGDGRSAPEIVWRYRKGAPQMSSPLVAGDELYFVNDKGVATCLDAHSGNLRWTERLGGNFSSSPLWADDRIYVGNREGRMYVLQPGPAYRLLATNTLDGPIMATPAAVGNALYVRTERSLYRLERTQ